MSNHVQAKSEGGSRARPPQGAPAARRAPPGAPAGPARDLQSSKALVDKLKAGRASRAGEADDRDDYNDDDDDDHDVICNPRIPVQLADESLADVKRGSAGEDEERWERRRREGKACRSNSGDGDSSDEQEMAELDSEVRATGFVSHRARKQLATGARSPINSNSKSCSGRRRTDLAESSSSPGRAAAAVVMPLGIDIDVDGDSDGDAKAGGESILSVFQQPSYTPSETVAARERFFDKAGLGGGGGGKETIGRPRKAGPAFAITAHEHGFMPLSAKRAYKGRPRHGGMPASARNGAADEGEFFETDKVYCTILRDRFSSKMYPEYQLVLDSTQKPLLLAKKMQGNKTSNYHLFDLSRGRVALKGGTEFDKKSGNYMGKLRASSMGGSDYVLYGNANSSSMSGSAVNNYIPAADSGNLSGEVGEEDVRRELAAISYERLGVFSQLRSGSQPRKLTVVLPPLDADAVPVANTYLIDDKKAHSFENCLRDPIEAAARECHVLESKEPTFENGNYRLNFNGRVSLPSVKNFQLVAPGAADDVVCQFGKVGDDTFHLDFKRPVTAFQAFSLALSQFNL